MTGKPTSASAPKTSQTPPSFNSSERSTQGAHRYTYFRGEAIGTGQKLSVGSMLTMSRTIIFSYGRQIAVPTTTCSKCSGLMFWEYDSELDLFLRIDYEWLKLGGMKGSPVCKCGPVISEPALASKADPSTMAHMGSKANEVQVGGTHYKSEIQHWDYVIANEIPYLEAMVIKYLTRWRKKGGTQDVLKAYHFMLKLAESLELNLALPSTGAEPDRGYVNQDRAGQKIPGK